MKVCKVETLVSKAIELKKAWVFGVVLIGKPANLPLGELNVPDYKNLSINALKSLLSDLESDIDTIGKRYILEDWSRCRREKAIKWMAQMHDEWTVARLPVWEIGRVYDIEQSIGRLGFRKIMECPLYAQVLVQGVQGAAIRHPEYHLARDLELLTNLFFDAELISDNLAKRQIPHSTEVNQSLARSTILTCFNLLEAFVSGVVAEFLMANPGAPDGTMQKLKKPDRTRNSLAARFEDVPAIITGKEGVMDTLRPVLSPLFGECKNLRNAYVHCVPSATATERGASKEARFHETEASAVRKTVRLTVDAIRASWKIVHGKESPLWLKQPDSSGLFPKLDMCLTHRKAS